MRNVEAKFRLRNPDAVRARAIAIGFAPAGVLSQRDTFFKTVSGKLKLREEPAGAWLIYYRRGGAAGSQLSDYEIVPVAEPERVRAIFSEAFGVIAEVRKQRTLLLFSEPCSLRSSQWELAGESSEASDSVKNNTRLHLDRVESLGDFGEIEAVLGEGETPEANQNRVKELLRQLGIDPADLIEVSYFELMS
ncbi:MAG: class IV adenylate cyclase [Candidatus Binataceae bacterium]